MIITVKAQITADGRIQVDLPDDHPVGEVTLIIEPVTEGKNSWEERPWTEAELQEMLIPEPSTLGEIWDAGLIGTGDELKHITDSATWVENKRQMEEERRPNRWTRS